MMVIRPYMTGFMKNSVILTYKELISLETPLNGLVINEKLVDCPGEFFFITNWFKSIGIKFVKNTVKGNFYNLIIDIDKEIQTMDICSLYKHFPTISIFELIDYIYEIDPVYYDEFSKRFKIKASLHVARDEIVKSWNKIMVNSYYGIIQVSPIFKKIKIP